VPGAGNPQAFNRYSYVLNSPLNYIDPTGHYACGDGEDQEECGQGGSYPGNGGSNGATPLPINPQDLIFIAVGVFAEASNGTHSDEAIMIMSWLWFNRVADGRDVFSDIENRSGAWEGIIVAYQAKYPGISRKEAILKAYECYTTSGCSTLGPNFTRSEAITKQAYTDYISGKPDPTHGGTMFSHQDSTLNGIVFTSIDALREYLMTNYSYMEKHYTREMAARDNSVYPFRYVLSQPYRVTDRNGNTTWLIVSAGTHPCVSVASCGANWTLPVTP